MSLVIGILIGVFLIPTIKELQYNLSFEWFKYTIRHPLNFIKDVIHRTFVGGY